MTHPTTPDALWLNVSPAFQRFDQKLLSNLAPYVEVQHWAYRQSPDEPCSLEIALTLLQDYIKPQPHPIHLLGHGTGGLLGLLYARQQPHRVKSLTLLSVGVNPVVDWQAHYYAQLEKLPCSRRQVLAQMAYSLFGHQARPLVHGWVKLLEADLAHSPSPHSLFKRISLCPGSVPVPLLVCSSLDDTIVAPPQVQGWKPWLKGGDRLWQCPSGRHFFHANQPQRVAKEILNFWQINQAQLLQPIGLEVTS
ncbi:MAG TPA: alpha/beta fold hydrolase [Leptolyngbyaceae cyanobacterium M65_K2018_010]|nr:alpha/beta fold hydrolase [Leptolyngbyaceae cyanobacterium M65_K2018_010]